MSFTRADPMIAWLVFVMGALMMSQGFLIAFHNMSRDAVTPMIGSRTIEQLIDMSMGCVLVGIVFGMLSEIYRTVVSKPKRVVGSEA